MVNLELYRVFYTVAKCGSLTKAAEELYISQPAVSQSVKQLESQLGISLFNRTHRGMELSAQGGKLIFPEVERALGLLYEAENRIAEMKASATGVIRIGASETIFKYFLAEIGVVGFDFRSGGAVSRAVFIHPVFKALGGVNVSPGKDVVSNTGAGPEAVK